MKSQREATYTVIKLLNGGAKTMPWFSISDFFYPNPK
jgi:hypothetical protein